MNIKIYLPLMALALAGVYSTAYAAPITPAAALQTAATFNNQRTDGVARAPRNSADFTIAATYSVDDRNCFYVVNEANGGFTIVSADDRLPQVLGFSDNGSFDPNNIPENLKWWLSTYEKDINQYLSTTKRTEPTVGKRAIAKERPAIAPMLTSKWNQTNPYNLKCPVDPRTGQLSVTGCVATAMAQVMRYHQWPKHPQGELNGFKFDGTTLDWANMIDEYEPQKYNNVQAEAVAELMHQCGVGVAMQYSSYESGAYSQNVQIAAREFFDYNKSMELDWRDVHEISEWNNIVYAELQANRPVYYSGASSLGGHAFVCDGYLRNNYFHFNWGWGGYQDGYFLLNALNPETGGTGSYSGGYNMEQMIIKGFAPSKGETGYQSAIVCSGGFSYDGKNYVVINDPSGYNMFYNPLFYPVTATPGLKVTPFDGVGEAKYYATSSNITLQARYGFSSISGMNLTGLADGKYKVTPAMRTQEGTWQDIGVPVSQQRYVTLQVSGGKNTFINEGIPETRLICGLPYSMPTIYGDGIQAFKVAVSNVEPNDFNGTLAISIMDALDEFGNATSAEKTVSIPGNSTLEVEFITDGILKPSTYNIFMFDYNDKDYLEDITFEAKNLGMKQPADNATVTVENVAPNFHTISSEGVPVSFTVTNYSQKDVTTGFTIKIYSTPDNAEAATFTSKSTVSLPGESKMNANFAPLDIKLEPGYYFWQILSDKGEILSRPYPLIITSEARTANGVTYYVSSEKDKTCYVSSPVMDEYAGSIVIPETINGYKVTDLRSDSFTFAEKVNKVTLPASIKNIEPATFYCAKGLKMVVLNGEEPPYLWEDAFDPDAIKDIILSPMNNTANIYAQEPLWGQFKIPTWTINLGEGLAITDGLAIDPLTNLPYSPYYVGGQYRLQLTFDKPAGMAIHGDFEINGNKYTDDYWDIAILPPLVYTDGTVTFTAVDGSGVDEINGESDAPADVYSIDGYLVLRNATKAEIANLPKGMYIIKGKGTIVK